MGHFKTADATVSAHNAVAVTKSDTTHFQTTRALYIGTGGNVSVIMTDVGLSSSADGTAAQAADVIFTNVADGTILPIQVNRVLSTGTTASDILALY